MIKRIFLFILINFLVVTTIFLILNIFHIDPYLHSYGFNLNHLLIFCFMWGMLGSLVSLLLSKSIAKWLMRVKIIDSNTKDQDIKFILDSVEKISLDAGLEYAPEIGVYESKEINAFATGPTQKKSLIALSSGLITRMKEEDIYAILAHEISHIANGDMVTMSLIQGVVNAFVMFLARILASFVSGFGQNNRNRSSFGSYYMLTFAFEMIFMILGSIVICNFSKKREFKADSNGARLAGKDKMIEALKSLRVMQDIRDVKKEQKAFAAFKISNPKRKGFMRLFSTHPPLEERIERLKHL